MTPSSIAPRSRVQIKIIFHFVPPCPSTMRARRGSTWPITLKYIRGDTSIHSPLTAKNNPSKQIATQLIV